MSNIIKSDNLVSVSDIMVLWNLFQYFSIVMCMLQHQSSSILLAERNSKKNACSMFLKWVGFSFH